jgi:hypothetical protein
LRRCGGTAANADSVSNPLNKRLNMNVMQAALFREELKETT